MKRFLTILLLTACTIFGAAGAVLPGSLPSHSCRIQHSTISNQHLPTSVPISHVYNHTTTPNHQDDPSVFVVIELDTVSTSDHHEPFIAVAIIDLSSGIVNLALVPQSAYREILADSVNYCDPTGLADVLLLPKPKKGFKGGVPRYAEPLLKAVYTRAMQMKAEDPDLVIKYGGTVAATNMTLKTEGAREPIDSLRIMGHANPAEPLTAYLSEDRSAVNSQLGAAQLKMFFAGVEFKDATVTFEGCRVFHLEKDGDGLNDPKSRQFLFDTFRFNDGINEIRGANKLATYVHSEDADTKQFIRHEYFGVTAFGKFYSVSRGSLMVTNKKLASATFIAEARKYLIKNKIARGNYADASKIFYERGRFVFKGEMSNGMKAAPVNLPVSIDAINALKKMKKDIFNRLGQKHFMTIQEALTTHKNFKFKYKAIKPIGRNRSGRDNIYWKFK